MRYLPLIWSNLKRKKARTLLTVLSVLVAFVLFGYLSAIWRALDAGVSVAGADRLVVRHRVSLTQPLPINYQAQIAALDGVAAVTHASWFGGIYQDPKNFFAQMPVIPTEFLAMFPEFLLPAQDLKRWDATRTGAIVGRKTADKYGWKVGDRIPIQATIWVKKDQSRTWDFDLVGIYDGKEKGTDTTQFFFRYDYFDEARLFGEGLVGWYYVRVKDASKAEDVSKRIDELFMNSSAETKAETEGAFASGFAKQVGDIATIVLAILSAVFFTILLVAGNTMAQAVRERTEELGVMKAVGFTDGRVLGLVLAESCCLASLGGALGLAVAWLAVSAGDPTRGALPMFYLMPVDLVAGLALMLGLGLVSGAMPAWQAMRLQVAEALRRVH